MIIRDDIPLGLTRNAKGQTLTFKDNTGFWFERTYDGAGQLITFKDSENEWRERTYNSRGQILTYRNSKDYWCEYTYDADGNELTFANSTGNWKFLAESEHKLYVNEETGIYWAGCQRLKYKKNALAYLRGRKDTRAKKFREAIEAHHNHLEQA